jgi:hypothetical protein
MALGTVGKYVDDLFLRRYDSMNTRLTVPSWLAFALFCCIGAFGQEAAIPPQAAPATPKGKMAAANIWLTDRVDELKMSQRGPFVRLANGSLLSIGGDPAFRSADEGKAWQVHARMNQQTDRFARKRAGRGLQPGAAGN